MQVDPIEELPRNVSALGSLDAAQLERELYVAGRSEPRQQSSLLEHERHAPVHVPAPACRLVEAREDVEQRALAGTGGADDAHELALFDLQRHAFERDQKPIAVRERHR